MLPRVLNLRGVDSIRATAVKIGAGAVAFAGPSEAGKSTLAAYFLRKGFPLLTDEILVFAPSREEALVLPGIPELFLRSDSVHLLEKSSPYATDFSSPRERTFSLRTEEGEFWPHPTPLERIYIVTEQQSDCSDQVAIIDNLPGRQAFLKLLKLSYLMDPGSRQLLQRQADLFQQLISTARVRQLSLTRAFDSLPRAAELILEDYERG